MRHIATTVFLLLFSLTLIGSSITPAPGIPADLLTTKGDLIGFSTEATRIPVGSNGQILSANSAQASGVEWIAAGGGADANAIYRNGSQPPTANQPWGGFGITGISSLANGNTNQLTIDSAGSLTHNGATGHQPYTISRRTGALDRMTIQGKTPGLASSIELFSNDGDNTDAVIMNMYGLGTPASITNSERLNWFWDVGTSTYRFKTAQTGTGVLRPLAIETGSNTNQFLINIDGSVTHTGASGQQPYQFTRSASQRLAIQSKTTGLASDIFLFANDGDGTDNVNMSFVGLGTPASLTNSERLNVGWSIGTSEYQIGMSRAGTGVVRPINIFTGTNTNQLKLNTDGSVQVSGDFKIVTAGKGIQVKSGTNGMAGVATLVAGTVTVANTLVTAATICLATVKTLGTVTVPTPIQCEVTPSTNIVITSANVIDTSTIAYHLIEAN